VTRDSEQDNTTPENAAKNSRWRDLATEGRHPESEFLDTLASEEIVSLLLEEDRVGLEIAARQRSAVAIAADWVAETVESGGILLFVGAGTSGRLGILEAAECPPTFGTEPEKIRAVMAGGADAVFRAAEGAEDREADGRAAVRDLGADDLLIALSASSVTPYSRGALDQARRQGARTILLTCAPRQGLDGLGDLVLALDTGPEILTGSTRLKAASATKAVLNAITTTAMVRLGKIFGNLMVDLRPGSAKLRDRAVRIIETAGGVSATEAAELYRAADEEVKTAIVMARCGLSADAARRRLAAAGGHVRKALEATAPEI
jgi:N-acetylmuramic acid 6-phosphate etherase